ncbi:hypothetical protein BDW74DRAFT_187157 [Aspergillus multicolor]|uniref:uncharacterized protein n=1 Tax=Aspergillus multicolor TaxID=41759 RepID=UPI003CCE4A54
MEHLDPQEATYHLVPPERGRRHNVFRVDNQRLAWFELLLQDCFVQDLRAAMKDKSASWAVPIIRSPDSYLHQEKMLASVHDYIFSIFKSPNWTFTSTDMLDPTGSTDTDRAWKRLSDQVWGAGSLFRGPSRNAGSTKLKRIILDMEQIVGSDDPQFMVRIWRICRYLHGICASTGDERHLKAHFLHRLRDSLKARTGERSPVFRFFDALSSMDTDCFLWALRIGNWRAMQCFERVIGAGHPLVLTMWVYYSKQWRVADKSYGEIIEYYSNALQSADESLRRDSDTAISILHDYTYFVHYSAAGKANAQAATLANDLYERTWTRMLDANCTWDNKTQYFTFASQVLAEHWNALGNWYNASGYLEKASGLLQVADRECKVRAGMLLGRLQRWWEHWGRPEEAEGVRQRQEALQASVDRLLQEEIQTERAS